MAFENNPNCFFSPSPPFLHTAPHFLCPVHTTHILPHVLLSLVPAHKGKRAFMTNLDAAFFLLVHRVRGREQRIVGAAGSAPKERRQECCLGDSGLGSCPCPTAFSRLKHQINSVETSCKVPPAKEISPEISETRTPPLRTDFVVNTACFPAVFVPPVPPCKLDKAPGWHKARQSSRAEFQHPCHPERAA